MTDSTSRNQAPEASDGNAMSDALAALSAIESVLGADDQPREKSEFTFEIPLSEALALAPQQYIKNADVGADGSGMVSVTVEDLFNQLRRGKVTVTMSDFAYFLPSHLLTHEAFEDRATAIVLPLATVVKAINVESLKKRTSQHMRRYHIDDLDDPFAKPTAAPAPVVDAPAAEDPRDVEPVAAEVPSTPADEVAHHPPAIPPAEELPPPADAREEPEPEEEAVTEVAPGPEPAAVEAVPEPAPVEPIPPVPAPTPVAPTPVPAAPAVAAAVAMHASAEAEYREVPGNVNLNTATVQQLRTLKGLTRQLAERIVRFRTEQGEFKSVFDLIQIPKLGRTSFKHITGMPYSRTQSHRSHRLAGLLKMRVADISNIPAVAEALAQRPGLCGCLISGEDGLLVAQKGMDQHGDALSAIVPKLVRQVHESMELVEGGHMDSVTLSVSGKMYTIVPGQNVALTVVHDQGRITKSQLSLLRKVAKELAWLLSHRGYVGPA